MQLLNKCICYSFFSLSQHFFLNLSRLPPLSHSQMRSEGRIVLATMKTDCWLAGSNASKRKCSGGGGRQKPRHLIFIIYYLFTKSIKMHLVFFQRVQGAGRVYPDAPCPTLQWPDTQYDDAQPHDPQPYGDRRGCSGRGGTLASRPFNSDLSPLDAPAWSSPSLALQLTIQYVNIYLTKLLPYQMCTDVGFVTQ